MPEPLSAPIDAGTAPRVAPKFAPRPRPWLELEQAGRYAEAREAVRGAGAKRVLAEASADELLAIARACRFAADDALSTDALTTVRRRFPGAPQAAMSAFLLGREAQGVEAARWFSQYLAEQPTGALAREASGRLLEALTQAGQPEQARTAAKAYLERYPEGPHAPYARSLLEP